MDGLLARVTQQAMNYAIRSGITLTTTYALRQSARLIRRTEDPADKAELSMLQEKLEAKIRIVAPAIDLIELISARGNTSLETAVGLTKSLRWSIQSLGQRIAATTAADSLKPVIADIKRLLTRIEDAVPLINLAITTSGVSLSGTLPPGISPSRLLQASTFVTAGDSQYARSVSHSVQIGPTFTLSLYMLFAGHIRPETEADVRNTTWKEVLHKARVKLMRVPLDNIYDLPEDHETTSSQIRGTRSDEFAYQMLIVEDLDDDRVHTYEDGEARPSQFCDVERAGIREPLPIHEISKIFYADTGKILNIGDDVETNSPVLLLKRDIQAVPPRRMLEREELERSWETSTDLDADLDTCAPDERASHKGPVKTAGEQQRIPKDLDPEWLAFEVYIEDTDSDTESSEDVFDSRASQQSKRSTPSHSSPLVGTPLHTAMSHLSIHTPPSTATTTTTTTHDADDSPQPDRDNQVAAPPRTPHLTLPPIRTSLSLLETMLRLLSLQQFQQTSHLAIPDELLSFFLSEATSTTGAAPGDQRERRTLRQAARRRVGFDPYDESPIKRRGEDYLRDRGGTSHDGGSRETGPHVYALEHGHVSSVASSPQLPRPDQTEDRAAPHRVESEPAPSPPELPTLQPKETRQTRKAKAKSASPAPAPEWEESAKESLSSPIVNAQMRQLRSRDRVREGSPLAHTESADEIRIRPTLRDMT